MSAEHAEAVATLDLGAMMSETLDTIPDAPDFTNPPAGEYTINVKDCAVDKYKSKAEPDVEKQRLKITYTVVTTHSTMGNEPPVPDGSMFTETFQATEQGIGYFKKRVKELMGASDLVGVSLGDMMSSVKGAEVKCKITIRESPNSSDPLNPYKNLNIRIVAAGK